MGAESPKTKPRRSGRGEETHHDRPDRNRGIPPGGDTAYTYLQIEEAKDICGGCAVRQACLDWAVDHGQDAGIWGGLTEDERRSLKRRATTPLRPLRDWV